ncbi:efflux RND transporter permease subunit [Anaeromyxobacter sp. PSR-1]|uniref:efflux RND transporter permease subunit n=1 Tax=Anaeromyxobacter sp. PSR-1 TaxID=1300915 RepID=UPI0005DAC748|nr:efflux RND transporter permease subunit [Anaeromyxobacter sp. PSR-1]GAO01491.1 nodulation protein NolG [Anaeromyxobacter sp. PSR-1]
MSYVARYVKRPHLLLSLVLLLSVVGVVGYFRMPVNLFPDSERPQIAVVTVWRGASADDVSAEVSRVIEKEVKTIDLVRRVTSTSNDEVSVVNAEFEYEKGLDSAATDVRSALDKIRPLLPPDLRPFQVFKVSSATPAVLTLSIRSKEGAHLDLAMVRRLAENPIKERLLRLPEIGNVEVFGGYQSVVRVSLDPDRLQAFRLSPGQVATALAGLNRNIPEGLVVTDATHLLLKTAGEFRTVEDVAAAVVSAGPGAPIYLRDVATAAPGVQERLSAFHGNGKPAIGINVQRPLSGHALPTIQSVMKALPHLERDYPGLAFEVADTQGELIQKSVSNMADALRDAILMTALVIFLFLADVRGMLLAAISIPFTYLVTFAFMWLFGFELNMVTLTGVILGVGMLLDDAIVVLENIERHHKQLGKDLGEAVVGGTEEVMLAILSGTYATVVVLMPIIFIGGFVQTVLRPLSLTLSIALLASYVVSVTVLPILAPVILRLGGRMERWRWEKGLDRFVSRRVLGPVQEFFARAVRLALRHPLPFLLPAVMMLVLTGRVLMPLVGRDLMPPMDTGIFRVTFEAYPNASLSSAEALLGKVEKIVWDQGGVVRSSATLGSEPGVLSFGSGRNAQQAFVTVHLVDRFHRGRTLWQVEDEVRRRLSELPGLRYPAVFDYGATPLSTIRSTVDLVISGSDPAVLDRLARDVERRMLTAGGVRSVARTWTLDRAELRFAPSPELLSLAGTDPSSVAAQLGAQVQGGPATLFRVPQQDSFPIWLQAPAARRTAEGDLATLPILTASGPVPLSSLGEVSRAIVPTLHSRQNLVETVDVLGYRGTDAVTHLGANVDAALAGLELPPGYTITDEGERKAMAESFSALMAALLLGLVLLYFSLVPAFRSFLHPLTIMVAIPLGLIGAAWAMLVTGKHQCMPSFMGMILLAGIVVKNSILLIDFIQEARARGASIEDALVESVRVRTRPILMTAAGTAVGMLPIALEWAIGLERLSPLAIVAIGGLVVSTFLTLLYVPLIYDLLERAKVRLRRVVEVAHPSAPDAPGAPEP